MAGTVSDNLRRCFYSHSAHYEFHDDALYKLTFTYFLTVSFSSRSGNPVITKNLVQPAANN